VIEISQPLENLDWIPRPRLLALHRLGVDKVEDLLTHFPRRYEDRQQVPDFPAEESEKPMCVCGEVVKDRRDGVESASGLPLVQSTLRPENDRDWPSDRGLRKAASAGKAHLHGSP